MIHLRSVSLKKTVAAKEMFPFNVPIIKSLTEIAFTSEVTLLVGENGSGKSTFLEAIAAAVGSITVGSDGADTDRTLGQIHLLARSLKLTWSKRTRTGFFLRSEDFFGYVKRLALMRENLLKDLHAVDEEYTDRSDYARGLARMPYLRELNELHRYYGEDLDGYSHGESYFTLFKSRFVPNGLYLLDEPEAPLSPLRQIIFLSMLKMMIGQNAQFIIATHSPIILAFPNAAIFSFDSGRIEQVTYDSLEHVQVMKSFLNNPEQYLKRMFEQIDRP